MRKIPGTKILKNGKRKIEVYVEKKVGGKRRRFYATEITKLNTLKAIAARRREMLDNLKASLEPNRQTINPEAFTFVDLLDKWMAETCRPKLAVRTYQDYEKYIKDFIVPFLNERGNFLLSEFSPVHVHDLFEFLKRKNKGWAIDKMHRMLSSASNWAFRLGLIDQNPVARIKKETSEKREPRILSANQIARLLANCSAADHGLAVELTLLTGMRPSETIAVRWSDISFAEKILFVRQSVTHPKGGGFVFKQTKSRKSKRKISLSFDLIEKLRQHKADQSKWIADRIKRKLKFTDYDLVFPTRFGSPLRSTNLNGRDLKKILRKAGLPETFSLYSLRHSIASLLLSDGASVKDISEMLGHSSAAFTLDRYIHSIPDANKQLASRYSKILESEIIETDSIN